MTLVTEVLAVLPERLFDTVFKDRKQQFVDRHTWNLCVTPEGHEIDEYDRPDSRYLVVHEDGRHLASCRLRPASAATMLLDHFEGVFPGARDFLRWQAGHVFELTRFLRAPDLDSRETAKALMAFARGLDAFRDSTNASGFVAIVYPEVARFLRQNGVRFLVLDSARFDGRKVQMICLTQAAAAPELSVRQQAFASGDLAARPMPRHPEDAAIAV